jgi:hypothetical protein
LAGKKQTREPDLAPLTEELQRNIIVLLESMMTSLAVFDNM